MQLRRFQNTDVQHKRVLLRVDMNVTLKNGQIEDDTRIVQSLPTIKRLLQQKAEIIIVSHLGRPDGKRSKDLQMDEVATRLSELLKHPVEKVEGCIEPAIKKRAEAMKEGEIIMLENVRFYPEEEQNDPKFAEKLASLAEIYINDAFGTAHRAHASTEGVAKYLPAYAGFLMQKEVDTLSALLEKAERPLTLIAGGAKIDTKIGIIQNFITKADYFLIGGGLANTFLAAAGFDIGNSLYEKDKLDIAQQTMLEAESFRENFVIPKDAIVADEVSATAKTLDIPVEDVEGDMKILDIGSLTTQQFIEIIEKSKTIIWNGPVGVFDQKPFENGTKAVAKALKNVTSKGVQTIIGGGDTIDALHQFGFKEEDYTHVSTGGGAMLEFLEGKILPGIEVLLETQPFSSSKKL